MALGKLLAGSWQHDWELFLLCSLPIASPWAPYPASSQRATQCHPGDILSLGFMMETNLKAPRCLPSSPEITQKMQIHLVAPVGLHFPIGDGAEPCVCSRAAGPSLVFPAPLQRCAVKPSFPDTHGTRPRGRVLDNLPFPWQLAMMSATCSDGKGPGEW